MKYARPILVTDTLILSGKQNVCGVKLIPGLDAFAKVELFDEADTSKTATKLVDELKTEAGISRESTIKYITVNGLYVDVTGTGAKAVVYIA